MHLCLSARLAYPLLFAPSMTPCSLLESRLLRAMVSLLQSPTTHYACYVAGRGHNDRLRILAILLSLRAGPATEQAATCDWVYATEPDHYGCHVAGRGHSDHFCILAIILSLCGGPATEQANKSGGTLATIQSIRDSAEESHIVVKDEHHCCRALLFASHAIVRSGSNGKQRWQP